MRAPYQTQRQYGVGDFCLAPYEDRSGLHYYRARVEKLLPQATVQVRGGGQERTLGGGRVRGRVSGKYGVRLLFFYSIQFVNNFERNEIVLGNAFPGDL